MEYEEANEAKATFSDVYTAPTPHAYVKEMHRHGYEIGEQARPFCCAAAELLKAKNGPAWPVTLLDVGCSYGIGAAFVKFGCSFQEIVSFFASRAPEDYHACCEATRSWLNVISPACDVRTVGLDSSAPAIRFAVDAGLLDGGIARSFETDQALEPSDEEAAWFRSANLLISTGAIGYITERTLNRVLPHLGRDHPTKFGPFAVTTILRMFDEKPIAGTFESHGLRFEPIRGVLLPQRRFADHGERTGVLEILDSKDVDTREWEARHGKLFAALYVAAPPSQIEILKDEMRNVARELVPA